MFHLGRDDMAFSGVGLERGGNGGIVAFRPTRAEDDIHRVRPNQFGNLLARRLDHRFELCAELVRARRIAPFRREVRHHRFQHRRQNRRRCVVVEVDHTNSLQFRVYSSQQKTSECPGC